MRLAALAVLAAAAVGTVAAQARAPAPSLRIADRNPLTVVGVAFEPRERVVVTARGDVEPARAIAIASRTGRFRARLGIAFDPCTGPEVIRAAGVKGSVALLKLSLRECPGPVLEP